MSEGHRQLLEPGDRLGGFEIEAVLGVGATSVTYRARQGGLERPVMLKVFHEHAFAADPALRAGAEAEASRAARLEHPAIATVYDMGSVGDAVYVAAALLDAEPLPDLVAAGKVSPRRCVEIVTAIAAAIDTAHGQSVVHREVRPEAISVGRWGNPVLRDFGIGRISGRTGLATRMELAETLRYVAPEMVLGREATESADIYGLAATAVFCLTGTHPFPDLPPAELLSERVDAPPPRLDPDQPALTACIDAAMSPDPTLRPESAAAFATALGAAVDELPEELREQPSPFSLLAQARRRRPAAVSDETRIDRRREPQASAEEVPDDTHRGLWVAAAVGLCAVVLMFGLGHATAPGPAAPLRLGAVEVDLAPLWETGGDGEGAAAQLPGAVALTGGQGDAVLAPLPPSSADGDPREGLPAAAAKLLAGSPQPVVAADRVLLRYGDGDFAFLARGEHGGLLVSCSSSAAVDSCAALAAKARRGDQVLAPQPPSSDDVDAVAEAMGTLESRRGIAAGEFKGKAVLQATAASRLAGANREAAEALTPVDQPGIEALVKALEGAADAYEDLSNALDRGGSALAGARAEAKAADEALRESVEALRYWGFPVDG